MLSGDDPSCGRNLAGVLFTNSLVPNQWHHVVAVWDSSASTLTSYYDGRPAGTISDTYWPANFGHVQIGVGYDTTRYWTGQIDEVRMSSAVRSADWIATEYNNQATTGHL